MTPEEQEATELSYSSTPFGPSSESCCRVINRNKCGSGSIVGVRDGKSLVLTNAHVSSSRIGTVVQCFFPFASDECNARVIMAAYSNKIMMDWAVLECDKLIDLPAVKLSIEDIPNDMYTMGYPSCFGPRGQDLNLERTRFNGVVAMWLPIAIPGQSGSAVHSYENGLQVALVTWQSGIYGAGQTTKSIWMQYSTLSAVGHLKPEGFVELTEGEIEGLEEGFFYQTNITNLPIWAHLSDDDGSGSSPPPESDPPSGGDPPDRGEPPPGQGLPPVYPDEIFNADDCCQKRHVEILKGIRDIIIENTNEEHLLQEIVISDYFENREPSVGITISPVGEEFQVGTNERDDIVYVTQVARVVHALGNDDLEEKSSFRSDMRQIFHNKRLKYSDACYGYTRVEFGGFDIPSSWQSQNNSVSVVRIYTRVRESRSC